MKHSLFFRQWAGPLASALALALAAAAPLAAEEAPKPSADDLAPLQLKLPPADPVSTPKDALAGTTVEPAAKPQPPLLIPKDAGNVAPGKKITCSDKNVSSSDLAKLTDGDKEADGSSIVLLHKGLQWVQFDLGVRRQIFAVVIWHAHDTPKVCRSVIVQAADDGDFTGNVTTLFNNDRDNSAGLGVGADRQYFESYRGRIIDAKGARARYLRLYSNGSTESPLNEYTEVEIYARPSA
jgi:hypothetical protein